MSRPTPGQQYTVQSGDTLADIATQAYGLPAQYTRIMRANGISDKIRVGQVLLIPVIPELETIKRRFFSGNIKEKGFRLKIEDRVIPVQAGRLLRTMDTPADGWTAVIAWEPGLDARLDELTTPFLYPNAQVYLDGELMVSGRLYTVRNKIGNDGRVKELEGFSYTADIIDSHAWPPYESSKTTLLNFCKDMLENMGLEAGVKVDEGVDVGEQFEKETVSPTESIFNFLKTLGRTKGVLFSSTPEGDLLLTRAKLNAPIVGTIEENKSQLAKDWAAEFDGRKLFRFYRAVLPRSADIKSKVADLLDETVPAPRLFVFNKTKGNTADLKRAVAWKRNQTLAEAMQISLPVTGWYAYNKELWTPNTRVTVKSKTLGVPEGFTFLIKRVEFSEDQNGQNALLYLIPPTVYSDLTPDLPWVKKTSEARPEDLKKSSQQ